MKPDTDLLGTSFTTSSADLSDTSSGIARIFLSNEDMGVMNDYMYKLEESDLPKVKEYFQDGYFIGNLLIDSASFAMAEKSLIQPHFGDAFSIHFFGKSPMVLSASGVILNPYDDSHKAGMYLAYKNVFRLSRVAKMGISPALSFLGYTIPGAMLGMNMVEDSSRPGVIQINFEWLIFRVIVQSLDNEAGTTNTMLTMLGNGSDVRTTTQFISR